MISTRPICHGARLGGRLRGATSTAHLTWMVRHDYPNVMHYVPDLVGDKLIARYNRRYYWWVALGLILPALLGGLWTASLSGALSAFLWGGIVRLLAGRAHHVGHQLGVPHDWHPQIYGAEATIAAIMPGSELASWGEAFHNNHHAFPWSAAFGLPVA